MAIMATDILLKTMIEAAIQDLKKNQWILDDVFGSLATDPLSSVEYGYKEVQKAKEWFLQNEINVYLQNRIDVPTFPCITIVHSQSSEKLDRTAIGDTDDIEQIYPRGRASQPTQIVKPFTPSAFDPNSSISGQAIVTMPPNMSTFQVAPGQFYVSAVSGKAYQILQVLTAQTFTIKSGMVDDFTGGYIVPATALWNLNREITFMDETYAIGVHTASYPVNAIWLRQALIYMFFRYKEAYLEGRGYELSTIQASPVDRNPHFEKEVVYSAVITLTGQCEASWIKYIAPKLQKVTGKISIIDGPKTPPGYAAETKGQAWQMQGDEKKGRKGFNGYTQLNKKGVIKPDPEDEGDTGGF